LVHHGDGHLQSEPGHDTHGFYGAPNHHSPLLIEILATTTSISQSSITASLVNRQSPTMTVSISQSTVTNQHQLINHHQPQSAPVNQHQSIEHYSQLSQSTITNYDNQHQPINRH